MLALNIDAPELLQALEEFSEKILSPDTKFHALEQAIASSNQRIEEFDSADSKSEKTEATRLMSVSNSPIYEPTEMELNHLPLPSVESKFNYDATSPGSSSFVENDEFTKASLEQLTTTSARVASQFDWDSIEFSLGDMDSDTDNVLFPELKY